MKDYYQILGVEKDATQEEIKKQYLFLIRAMHPDKHPTPDSKRRAEKKAKEINDANDILKDPRKRAAYDNGIDPQHYDEYERQQKRAEEESRFRREQAEAERRRAEEEQRQRAREDEVRRRNEYERQQKVKAEERRQREEYARQQQVKAEAERLREEYERQQKAKEDVEESPQRENQERKQRVKTDTEKLRAEQGRLHGKEITNPIDDSVLIEIPAGSFIMGSNENDDEGPIHTVYLDRYYIGKYEVTVGQFKKYCNATGTTMPEQPSWNNRDDHPVVNVTWNDAKTYCDWAGLRLPTEAEWEKAARGTDGRIYPWGNEWDNTKCNSDGYAHTSPVGSFSPGVSPYGVYDMEGNVWEWCNDWFGRKYYSSSPLNNPTGPASGSTRVLRGGSWFVNLLLCRSSTRLSVNPKSRSISRGFRPAK